VPRELAADSDRILPGDGDFQLAPLIDLLRKMSYSGWISLEVLNPVLWQTNPQQVVEIAWTSLRKLLVSPAV
jgi:2-keto-myo-inositol isomerase